MRRKVFIVLLLMTAALSGIVIGRFSSLSVPTVAPSRAVALQSGTALSPARPLPDFDLQQQDGAPAGRDGFRGRWTLVFFGFTHCPELCPTTLAMLSGLRDTLAVAVPEQEVPGIALFSADPERDTPAVLEAYLAGFGTGLRGYTGTPEAMRNFATALGVPYQKIPMGDDYMIDHSVTIMLVNPQAEVAALFQPPHDPAKLQADYLQMISAAR